MTVDIRLLAQEADASLAAVCPALSLRGARSIYARENARISALVVLLPVAIVGGLLRTHGPVAWPIVPLAFVFFVGVAWLLHAIGTRDVAVGANGIAFRGIWGREFRWSEIADVRGFGSRQQGQVTFP